MSIPKLNVKDVMALVPKAEIYELKTAPLYIIAVKPSSIIGANDGLPMETINKLKLILKAARIRSAFIVVDMSNFQIFSLTPED